MTSAKPGIVLDVGGDGELAAGLDALDQDRLQHGARRIDGGRVAGRARADDDDLGVGGLAHRKQSLSSVSLLGAAGSASACERIACLTI